MKNLYRQQVLHHYTTISLFFYKILVVVFYSPRENISQQKKLWVILRLLHTSKRIYADKTFFYYIGIGKKFSFFSPSKNDYLTPSPFFSNFCAIMATFRCICSVTSFLILKIHVKSTIPSP